MPTAAILAGGRARRFGGRPKALLPIGGLRIIDRLLAALRPVVGEVILIAREDEPYRSLGLPIRHDVLPGTGPLGGIYTALVATTAPRTLVVAADMPFLNALFLERLLDAGRGVDIAVPRTADGYQPLCASYAATCAALIRRRLDEHRLAVHGVLADARVREIGPDEMARLDPTGTLCFNVNTPADYARALALAAARPE
ncbi:MAG: molybdenum cofactor guanylyltransferase [Acidobacteria bacterium]|nr:molybdenum cofactor guanylyltransferase [Acidobacteriota bacterium]MCY4660511.1 molybdenum cofactor guanylyltransferase [Acidobacteriota bacterium]